MNHALVAMLLGFVLLVAAGMGSDSSWFYIGVLMMAGGGFISIKRMIGFIFYS